MGWERWGSIAGTFGAFGLGSISVRIEVDDKGLPRSSVEIQEPEWAEFVPMDPLGRSF